jgi:hypothetical protein
MRRGVWEDLALLVPTIFCSAAPGVVVCEPRPARRHCTMWPGCHPLGIAAVKWREGSCVKTIKGYVSLSGSAEAKNCESFESVFPRGLVRLSRVAKVLPV